VAQFTRLIAPLLKGKPREPRRRGGGIRLVASAIPLLGAWGRWRIPQPRVAALLGGQAVLSDQAARVVAWPSIASAGTGAGGAGRRRLGMG